MLLPVMQKLRGSTGFSPVEVFRKYLWFLLRERKFDAAAVEDMVLLKGVLGLSDEQVRCVHCCACCACFSAWLLLTVPLEPEAVILHKVWLLSGKWDVHGDVCSTSVVMLCMLQRASCQRGTGRFSCVAGAVICVSATSNKVVCFLWLQVAEALQERAQRIYDKYGTLMLNVDGFTAEGVERKATCRALFSKLLYLTEHEPLVAQGSEAFKTTDLRMVRACLRP
jgi:hypothetical protein